MKPKLTLTLAISMMMFPQVVETIYSPALTYIAEGFDVSSTRAAQTLSLYFFAFAFGVVFWGRMCDLIGRRKTIVSGISLYTIASYVSFVCKSFDILLIARIIAAFGASVGSIGTQTAIRDKFNGDELARVFSVMGVAMAISPAIGILSGSILSYYWGYQGVFGMLLILAVMLLVYTLLQLPETRPKYVNIVPFIDTLKRMISDSDIWYSALLVALFNISMFSYYQLAPFSFQSLGFPMQWFGFTGIILALGIGIGAIVNKKLVNMEWVFIRLMILASSLSFTGGVLLFFLEGTVWFVFPMMLVVMAYGIAIPNILARALRNYKDCTGTAGAILGLMYYSMLGAGLTLAGLMQQLGLVLTLTSAITILLIFKFHRAQSNIYTD